MRVSTVRVSTVVSLLWGCSVYRGQSTNLAPQDMQDDREAVKTHKAIKASPQVQGIQDRLKRKASKICSETPAASKIKTFQDNITGPN